MVALRVKIGHSTGEFMAGSDGGGTTNSVITFRNVPPGTAPVILSRSGWISHPIRALSGVSTLPGPLSTQLLNREGM